MDDLLDFTAARSDLDHEGMEDRTRRLTTQQESCHQADRTLAACRDRLGVLPEESSPGSDSLPALDPETLGTMIRLQQRLLRHQIQVDELESLENDSLKTGAGLPWWLTSLAGIVLLLGSAGALLWADNRIPVEGLLVAGLIGVNAAIYSPSGAYAGVGFAIPVDTVKRIVPQLILYGEPGHSLLRP